MLNQIRYRGYYLDTETGYYYLMSRYYNPIVGRFLNADIFCSTGDSVFATNMYVYCLNNPVNSMDSNGLKTATETVAVVITEIFVCWDLQKIAEELKINFSFTNLSDYFDMKVLLYKKAFDEGLPGLLPSVLDNSADASGKLSTLLGFMSFLPNRVTSSVSVSQYIFTIWNDNSQRYLSFKSAMIMTAVDLFLNGISDAASIIISKLISPIIGNLIGIVLGGFSDLLGTRTKAEYIAYNWYFL